MGVMPMETVSTYYDRGYPYTTRTIYVYCDTCGSFQIKKIASVRQWFLIIGGFLFLYLLLYLQMGAYLIALMFIYSLFAASAWGPPAYECKKCGALTTTSMNTRRYTADNSLVDVPEKEIVKLYLGHWPDMTGELEDYLMPPEEEQPGNQQ